jgi:hypothetical protein
MGSAWTTTLNGKLSQSTSCPEARRDAMERTIEPTTTTTRDRASLTVQAPIWRVEKR